MRNLQTILVRLVRKTNFSLLASWIIIEHSREFKENSTEVIALEDFISNLEL